MTMYQGSGGGLEDHKNASFLCSLFESNPIDSQYIGIYFMILKALCFRHLVLVYKQKNRKRLDVSKMHVDFQTIHTINITFFLCVCIVIKSISSFIFPDFIVFHTS